jgi:LPXTG-motif cell wall-anchored protein
MAGNEIEYSYKNILVTTNAMRILAHKTWFKFLCGGIVLLGGAAAFFIRKRKNRLL